MTQDKAKGALFIVSAPSGAGKTSLVKALLDSTDTIAVSVSHTTRQPRSGEVNGQHYHFVDIATFESLRDHGDFLEYAKVFDNYYGTSASVVNGILNSGTDVILEIDWQGAVQVRNLYPDSVSIFIIPPSKTELEQRLISRGQDDQAVIERRMNDAVNEISHYSEFDYLVVNDAFDQALTNLRAIVLAVRQRMATQSVAQEQLLQQLLT